MKAKELIEYLQGNETAEVYIHDASTDADLPIGVVEMPYLPASRKASITLHVKDEDGGE